MKVSTLVFVSGRINSIHLLLSYRSVLLRILPLFSSVGSRSKNWLKSRNWDRECDFLLGLLCEFSDHPILIYRDFMD